MALATAPLPSIGATATRLQGLSLTLAVDPRWQPGVDELHATFAPWDTREAALVAVEARFDRTDAPRPQPDGTLPTGTAPRTYFSPDAAADGVYRDQTQGWDAELRLALDLPTTVAAHFALRDVPELRAHPFERQFIRELVASALRVTLASAAPLAGAMLVHGAALVDPATGRAVLFIGPSGAGKTTMARRLPAWRVLADDTVWVARRDDAWVVSGTPLRGKEGHPRSGAPVALQAVATLVPAAPLLSLERLGEADALRELLARIFWCIGASALEARLVGLAHALVAAVPVHRLASSLADDIGPLATALARGAP